MKAKILYLEDDQDLAFLTIESLSSSGHEVDHFFGYDTAEQAFLDKRYDICILDIILEEQKDGYDFLQMVRSYNADIPVIMLTAKVQEEDRIKGLKFGADDYVLKPFSIEELELRIGVFLRRRDVIREVQEGQSLGRFQFFPSEQKVVAPGYEKKLTRRETEVLGYLLQRKNAVIPREKILEDIWGKNDYFLGRSLDVFITKLRKYLESDPNIEIETIHSVGFRLNIATQKA